MSDPIDRAEFRQAISDAIGWDDRKTVADVYQERGGRFTDDPTPYEALLAVARWGAETALTYADHDDLLVTPAHDAAVAARALDIAASVLEGDTHVPDHKAGRAAIQFLRDRADQIEAGHE